MNQNQQQKPKYEQIGEAFLKQYYKDFDTNRSNCANYYGQNSLMTYQTDRAQGKANILKKLCNLKFSKIAHNPLNIDIQPDPRTVKGKMSLYVVCSGVLKIMEEKKTFPYVDFFHLVPQGNGYFIMNHIFQLTPG